MFRVYKTWQIAFCFVLFLSVNFVSVQSDDNDEDYDPGSGEGSGDFEGRGNYKIEDFNFVSD